LWKPVSLVTAALLAGAVAWGAPPASGQTSGSTAAPGSFRQAQELGIDLAVRPADLINRPERAAPGSFRAAQDVRSPIGRDLGGEWARSRVDDRDQTAVPEGPQVWDELDRRF
jgi:hypothetical protein